MRVCFGQQRGVRKAANRARSLGPHPFQTGLGYPGHLHHLVAGGRLDEKQRDQHLAQHNEVRVLEPVDGEHRLVEEGDGDGHPAVRRARGGLLPQCGLRDQAAHLGSSDATRATARSALPALPACPRTVQIARSLIAKILQEGVLFFCRNNKQKKRLDRGGCPGRCSKPGCMAEPLGTGV